MIIFDTIKTALTSFVWHIVLALSVALFVVSAYAYVLSGQKNALKTQIDGYNAVSDSYIQLQKEKQANSIKEKEKVRVVYKDKIQYIERWPNDANKTDYENAVNFGRAYKPSSLLY